jgi:UrcA family protein
MRLYAIACGLLLAACSTTPRAQTSDAPQARFHYADLNLQDPADGQVLVSRVDQAASDYCRNHSAIVTPHDRRADPRYCATTIRVQLMWAMTPEVRRAYNEAWSKRSRSRGVWQ